LPDLAEIQFKKSACSAVVSADFVKTGAGKAALFLLAYMNLH
jgi:hypothetical protein